MNPAAKARLGTYATSFVGLVGLILAGAGLADFDSATGMIDIAPFNAYALAALVPTGFAAVLAPLALLKGWKVK